MARPRANRQTGGMAEPGQSPRALGAPLRAMSAWERGYSAVALLIAVGGLVAVDEGRARRTLLSARAVTVARRRQLLRDFDGVVESSRDVATDDEHDPEGATIAYERAKVTALVRQTEDQLADVDHALARLETGAYATCERCGGEIGAERLEARPSASSCVKCASP